MSEPANPRRPPRDRTRDQKYRFVSLSSLLRLRAAVVTVAYALFATLWIYHSDRTLRLFVPDQETFLRWSIYKGLGFVAITSLLLWALIHRAFARIETGYRTLEVNERRLRVGEARLAAIIGSAMDAIVTVDAAGDITLLNAAAEKMFGHTEAGMLGRPVSLLIPGELDAPGETILVREGLRANGETFPVEATVSRVEVDEQSLRTIILRDIGRRLAHEIEIERRKRLYAALSQINQAIVLTPDRDALLPKVCQALVEHGGFLMSWIGWHDPEAHRLLPVAKHGDDRGYLENIRIHTDDRPEGRGPSGVAFRENRPSICNDLLADPATLPWRAEIARRGFRSAAVFPIRLRDRPCGTLCVYADTPGFFQDQENALLEEAATDLSFALDSLAREDARRLAEAVALNEKRFSEAMIESMPGILYFYDMQGRFLRWNRNFETLSGYSGDEIARMHPLDFFAPADRGTLERRIAEVFQKGEASVESPFLAKDGSSKPCFFTGKRIVFQDTTCLVGVGIDISERTRAEAALRELNDTLEHRVADRTAELQVALVRAEASDRLKSAFLATMSHELRTPLNSIIGFTGIILQGLAGPLNPEQAKQLGMVRGSARHLLELINDVLDLSKIEAGQLEVRAEPFDLPATLERAVASVRPLAEKKGLALVARLSAAPATMTGDRRRVEQILLNLLNNAIKFTDRGGVTLDVELAPLPAAGSSPAVRLRVADTGIGIKPSELTKLFQPFRQLDTGLSRQHEGTGLGLAICRRLATLLGGEITASSTWAEGSVFTVTLPLFLLAPPPTHPADPGTAPPSP